MTLSSTEPALPLSFLSSRDWITHHYLQQETGDGFRVPQHSPSPTPSPDQRPPALTAHYNQLGTFNMNAGPKLRDSYSAVSGGVEVLVRTT